GSYGASRLGIGLPWPASPSNPPSVCSRWINSSIQESQLLFGGLRSVMVRLDASAPPPTRQTGRWGGDCATVPAESRLRRSTHGSGCEEDCAANDSLWPLRAHGGEPQGLRGCHGELGDAGLVHATARGRGREDRFPGACHHQGVERLRSQ